MKTTGDGPKNTVASPAVFLYKNSMICWGGNNNCCFVFSFQFLYCFSNANTFGIFFSIFSNNKKGTGHPFGQVLDSALYICNLKTLKWNKYVLAGETPLSLYGSSLVVVDNYIYILFGTNSRVYTSNVYKINIETLHCECLFNSVDMIENVPSYHTLIELNRQYPEEFLQGRYRQDVVVFNKKIIVFGGGSYIFFSKF